ncbi:MAG: tetratricopeptide repeat protein [Planctomycetes bacterium]|nr:tetratricopeptide repeat protein [Planctomycetota bacterium]
MADKPNENFDEAPKNPNAEDVFAGDLNLTPSTEDIFAGGKELDRVLEGQPGGGVLPDHSVTYQVQGPAASAGGDKKLSLTHVMLGLLTVAVLGLMLRPAVVKFPAGYFSSEQPLGPNSIDQKLDGSGKAGTVNGVAKIDPESVTSKNAAEEQFQFDSPLSWNLAHSFFTKKEYRKAHYIYKKLTENLAIDDSQRDMLKDVLNLQMALCLYIDGRSENLSSLLTVVLDSRSPAVRALANYYLAFIDFRGKRYLSARSRAYRALATLEIIKDYFPESMEADSYFLMANSITCEVMRLNNSDLTLPGKFWSDTLVPYFLPEMNARELTVFLNRGVNSLDNAVLEPIVENRKGITVGEKYSVIANKSAVDEVIAKFASISKDEVIWSGNSLSHKQFPVTMVMSKTSGMKIPEIALGSLGLIARFDGTAIRVCNSDMESSLEKQKELLTNEVISVWQRFLLRYRGDHRIANAHFSLAMMRELSEMHDVALTEYKIILSRHSKNSLAPFALLNSSKIKTNQKNYPAAQRYLKQLVLEYPSARIADEAYLYLAKANLSIKLYPEAFSLFKKVFHVNLTIAAKAEAAFGAAVSKFYLRDYKSSEEWFDKCFKVLTDPPSIDVYKAYYFMAKTKFNLGKYTEAVSAYKYALAGDLTKEEFSRIVIEITETLIEKGDIVEAANLIENIPEMSLPPKQQCEVVIAKSRIYNAMNLPGDGISILKQKIAYMANFQLRSTLMLELGRCYVAADELEKAYDEIAIAITDMPPGELLLTANNEFAEICMELGKEQQAVEVCLGVLNSPNTKDIRYQTCRILGRAYKKQKKYEKAAEAFAGIFDKYEISKNE